MSATDLELKKRTAELEEARNDLASFSYSVSHDLRAPLRTIDGFSQALAEDFGDRLGSDGMDYLNRIRDAAMQMDRYLQGVLELDRAARATPAREPVNLSDIASSIAATLKQSDPSRKVEFVIERDLIAHGDPSLLRVVIDKLLGNAWKFTSRHPTARIEFGVQNGVGPRVLYVRDDGAGFDPAYGGKLFKLFQRLHSEKEFEGIGSGLAIAQRIVSRHGGTIRATGQVEQGTTFYIELE